MSHDNPTENTAPSTADSGQKSASPACNGCGAGGYLVQLGAANICEVCLERSTTAFALGRAAREALQEVDHRLAYLRTMAAADIEHPCEKTARRLQILAEYLGFLASGLVDGSGPFADEDAFTDDSLKEFLDELDDELDSTADKFRRAQRRRSSGPVTPPQPNQTEVDVNPLDEADTEMHNADTNGIPACGVDPGPLDDQIFTFGDELDDTREAAVDPEAMLDGDGAALACNEEEIAQRLAGVAQGPAGIRLALVVAYLKSKWPDGSSFAASQLPEKLRGEVLALYGEQLDRWLMTLDAGHQHIRGARPNTVCAVLKLVDNARKRAGLSKRKLGLQAGLNPSHVCRMLTRMNDSRPRLRTVLRLAIALDVPITLTTKKRGLSWADRIVSTPMTTAKTDDPEAVPVRQESSLMSCPARVLRYEVTVPQWVRGHADGYTVDVPIMLPVSDGVARRNIIGMGTGVRLYLQGDFRSGSVIRLRGQGEASVHDHPGDLWLKVNLISEPKLELVV